MIVAPILIELRKQFENQIALFSGKDFTVETQRVFNEFWDFLVSRSPEQLIIEAPVVGLVEAKNYNLESGFAQCIAETIAAQSFNNKKAMKLKILWSSSYWQSLEVPGAGMSNNLDRSQRVFFGKCWQNCRHIEKFYCTSKYFENLMLRKRENI